MALKNSTVAHRRSSSSPVRSVSALRHVASSLLSPDGGLMEVDRGHRLDISNQRKPRRSVRPPPPTPSSSFPILNSFSFTFMTVSCRNHLHSDRIHKKKPKSNQQSATWELKERTKEWKGLLRNGANTQNPAVTRGWLLAQLGNGVPKTWSRNPVSATYWTGPRDAAGRRIADLQERRGLNSALHNRQRRLIGRHASVLVGAIKLHG